MSELKAGFGRVDVTPNIGYPILGYFTKRYADGIYDNLYANAVAFDDGEKRAVIISLDAVGMEYEKCDIIRAAVAEKINTDMEGVYLNCTHTHTGLGFTTGDRGIYKGKDSEVIQKTYEIVKDKICDAAMLAVKDLKPAKLYYNKGYADNISFLRRYRMIDGAVCNNPIEYKEFIDKPLGEADREVQHLIVKREDGFDIGIVNFQVHPDSITGSTLSADFPHFVRATYEKILDNTRCIYLNGTQGDIGNTDIRLPKDHLVRRCYRRAEFIGRKIAMAAIADYELAVPLDGTKVTYGQKNINVRFNKGKEEEYEVAREVRKIYQEQGNEAAVEYISEKTGLPIKGKNPWQSPAEDEVRRLNRIAILIDEPDYKELHLTAVRIGDAVFAGIPGEPFNEVGKQIKGKSGYALTIPTCCTNGHEGYYPTKKAFDEGGYEAITAKYAYGTAETIIDGSLELINSLK